ncbi:MAG: SAM-dependent methyltransferase [Sphingobacteriaceae bacterium]|jgi:SAM-dependent methyltransferase|nr:SAM-dependent methyltransferase [Sphingobacteriaceae bacterium]
MKVFNEYSEYYDLLYADKDYQSEADYIDNIIKKFNPNAKTILDLGCGTGIHAHLLSKKGYKVTGVDISPEMVNIANDKLTSTYAAESDMLEFQCCDITEIRLNRKYDFVISLFHVISYINENRDLSKLFFNINEHLNPNGSFFCDFWYGPGVLTDPPLVRIKRLSNSNLEVVRIAEPQLHTMRNVVDVNYTLFIDDLRTDTRSQFKEKHSMRYYFRPELDILLEAQELHICAFYDWLTETEVSPYSWNACLLASQQSEQQSMQVS